MSPKIFIEEFERTENSDYLHGVFGRCLIIATRFDSMCVRISKAIRIKNEIILRAIEKNINELDTENEYTKLRSEDEFNDLLEIIISKYVSLDNSIKSLGLPKELSEILHKARDSRNKIAHSLTKNLEGCLDSKINNSILMEEIELLIENIVEGDLIISSLISKFNNEPILNAQNYDSYKCEVIKWVISP